MLRTRPVIPPPQRSMACLLVRKVMTHKEVSFGIFRAVPEIELELER